MNRTTQNNLIKISFTLITPLFFRFLPRNVGIILFSLFLIACEQSQETPINKSLFEFSKSSSETNTTSNSPYGFDSEFNYPSFTGKFPVATLEMTLTDNSRLELLSNNLTNNTDNTKPRRFNVRFYYPSAEVSLAENYEEKNSNLAPIKRLPVISENAWANLVGPQIKYGRMLRYTNYEKAIWDIKLNQNISTVKTDFPLLIFSHGYGYSPESYTALSAELASQGYIVISINHTFGANPTQFVDNKDSSYWAKKLPTENIGKYLPTWSDDQLYVIEELYRLNTEISSPFYERLNLSQLGIFGHSYGGASAYLTASRDPRVKAIMDIDGSLFEAENYELYQPFAFVLSKDHLPSINTNKFNNDTFLVKLNHFEHISFTDHVLWWQWDFGDTNLGLGNIDSLEAIETTATLVKSFFDSYLLNKNDQWDTLMQENSISKKNRKIK